MKPKKLTRAQLKELKKLRDKAVDKGLDFKDPDDPEYNMKDPFNREIWDNIEKSDLARDLGFFDKAKQFLKNVLIFICIVAAIVGLIYLGVLDALGAEIVNQ